MNEHDATERAFKNGYKQGIKDMQERLKAKLKRRSKVKLERIKVIVREHLDDDPFEKAIAESKRGEPKGSTVGVKISVGGKQYGTYVCFKQSTLSASEVVESVNVQFETLLKGLEETE